MYIYGKVDHSWSTLMPLIDLFLSVGLFFMHFSLLDCMLTLHSGWKDETNLMVEPEEAYCKNTRVLCMGHLVWDYLFIYSHK